MIRKYRGYNVYIHNMGTFDVIFLMKYLVKLANVKPIIHKNRIITIDVTLGKMFRLHFKDSYLILLGSLRNLGNSLGTIFKKDIFQHILLYFDQLIMLN